MTAPCETRPDEELPDAAAGAEAIEQGAQLRLRLPALLPRPAAGGRKFRRPASGVAPLSHRITPGITVITASGPYFAFKTGAILVSVDFDSFPE